MAEDQNDIQRKIDELEMETVQPDFWHSKDRSKDVLNALAELKERKAKEEREKVVFVPKEIFLIITSDEAIFDPGLPSGKLVLDISAIVPELHVIFIGKRELPSQKMNQNTYIYAARNIPFFNLFTVYQVIIFQLMWKHHFIPTRIVSIGDEVHISKIFSWKYGKPLYVLYSYMKTFGKNKISMSALMRARPEKIIVPNEYIEQAIKSHHKYKANKTEIKIIPEYMDVPELEHIFDIHTAEEDVKSRNEIFNVILFPHQAGIACFSILKKIAKEVSSSIRKFQFTLVAKRGQFLQAKILSFLFNVPVVVTKEGKDSINLFRKARLMLYFDGQKTPYEPIFFSFVGGCPVLSSGDEYSKIILFNSEFEEFTHLERNGKIFGQTIKKLINDPYLYEKYKMNCRGFTKSAFTHDHNSFISELRDALHAKN